jgi:hypothetical protein
VTLEYLLATLAQLRAFFLQTLLNRVVVTQLLTAKTLNKRFSGTCASNLCFHKSSKVAPKTPFQGWKKQGEA